MIDAELALSVAFRAACAAFAVGFLEQLSIFDRAFGPRGPFSGTIAGIFGRRGSTSALLDRCLRHVLVAGALAGSAAVLLGPYSLSGRIAGVVVLASAVLTKLRRVMASDGAEQMAFLTLVAACIAVAPGPNRAALTMAVWFVACQSILSYATAGVAKVLSPTWVGGEAVSLIMSSESYGQPWAASALHAHPWVSRWLTRSVVVFECSFPLVLLAPREIAVAILAAGVAFHLGCAVTMGLNAFLIAFPGSYACVAYAAQTVSPFW